MTDEPRRGLKRKNDPDSEPQSGSSKASPTFLLLEVPAGADGILPMWTSFLSQDVDIAWAVNPYSISIHLTPRTTRCSSTDQTPTKLVVQPATVQQGSAHNTCVLRSVTNNALQPAPPGPAPSDDQLPPSPAAQAPSQPPAAPPLFHTWSSADVDICDRFLLGQCPTGSLCPKHHTHFPFHWQLWCLRTRCWVDVPPCSQVALERLYCNVDRETAILRDGHKSLYLNFDFMEMDDPFKYDSVRRLSNSENLLVNPHFPTKWRIYWWNDTEWKEYSQDLSTFLLWNMSQKEPECSFAIAGQEYEVDFTNMTQTNVNTGFQRDVRCRPVFRSPESMHPYLKTGVLREPAQPLQDPPQPNFRVDPLEDFTSWYPPVWSLASGQDYSLVEVPACSTAFKTAQKVFYESLPETKVDIISIQMVQNVLHWDKYQRHKVYMQKKHGSSKEPLERHLFHGTTRKAAEDICRNNFDPRVAGANGTSFGCGSYFATSAKLSHRYALTAGRDQSRHTFLAKVLVGEVTRGECRYLRPPLWSSAGFHHQRYDTCVDEVDNPSIFIVFDSSQCYPYFLIRYKDVPAVVQI
ncbi:protein mono-ADP-ribosyltransferase TIPARP-like [Dunckerocampus dactyliophorus]|uniref:protein mono-ADP-ribosyltransferase TIPARP-like n=1 Tax=Dunckerocampus dactyliophorus TaxID=161453 RepID=UPI002404F922|nr:protein mono-ADP-ribosyltransferase TIPARP-like [Dunckerocampus dactyliophorus]